MPYSYDPEAAGLIPEGVVILTVTSIEDTTSRRGDPMWVIRFEDQQRREVTEWVVQTPNIVDWKFKPLWIAAGLEWPAAAAIIDEQLLVDRRVQATIMHEHTADFGTQARIQGYVKPGTSDVNPEQEVLGADEFKHPEPARTGAGYGQDPEEEIPF